MMMSSLHLRLRLIFASACITHNALEKWSKASDRSCVCSIRAGFWGSITRALPPSFTLISSAVTGSNSGFISRMFTDSHPSHRLWVTWRDRHNATRNNEGQRASLRYAFWVIPSGSVLLQSSQRLNLSAVLHFVSSQPAAAPPSGTTQSAQFKSSALCTQGSLQRHHHKLRVWASAESNDSFQEVPQSCFY